MSTSVNNAFIRDYETRVHEVFQRRGSRLLPTVRNKPNVNGTSTTFQKIGKGTATTKARHGTITPMNQTHTAIEITFADFYAGDWVDKLDEAKINISERQALANGGAFALGRKVDGQITTALDATTQTVQTFSIASQNAIRNSLLLMAEALFANDVQNDGEVYGVLSSRAWAYASVVQEFTRADWVGIPSPLTDGPPMKTFRDWQGIKWQMHTGLPGAGTSTSKQFVYHKSAVGYASAKFAGNVAGQNAVSADITWHGDRASHFVNHMMSGNAGLIDDTGVIESDVDDTGSVPTS